MVEEENLYSRKARFCGGKDRFMKKRILTTALCLLLALICIFTLASCDAGDNSAMKDSMSEGINKPGQGGDLELDLNGSTIDKGESTTDRKIIKTAYVSAETKDFENALKLVEELCAEAKGYIESSSTRGVSLNNGTNRRSAEYTLRIPAEAFDGFNDSLGGILNIVSSSSNANEVTAQYYDIQSRVEVLELQKESLQKMYDNYTDYSDVNSLISLQDKLFSVIEEIEAYKTQLRLYDSKVSYSTVHLTINEVVIYTENQDEKTFGDKIADAFNSGWNVFVDMCQGLAIAFVASFPTLAGLGIVACGIIFICVATTRRSRKKKLQQNAQQMPRQPNFQGYNPQNPQNPQPPQNPPMNNQ